MYSILMKQEDTVKSIVFHFNNYVKKWERPDFTRDELYMEAFRERLTLEKYGIFPEEAAKAFDELTKLHLGYSVDEINKLTDKMADNNVRSKKSQKLKDENFLSEAELKAVTEYHKYLFSGLPKKNPKPFKW